MLKLAAFPVFLLANGAGVGFVSIKWERRTFLPVFFYRNQMDRLIWRKDYMPFVVHQAGHAHADSGQSEWGRRYLSTASPVNSINASSVA
ncbi:hypothetical protein PO124_04660 [Bacillus licheniformis]|nr:hypothetical protein [Bacillus licheniformis]